MPKTIVVDHIKLLGLTIMHDAEEGIVASVGYALITDTGEELLIRSMGIPLLPAHINAIRDNFVPYALDIIKTEEGM